jgi:hypothetical protein
LSRFGVERQDVLAVLLDEAFEPTLEQVRLVAIAAIPDEFHAATQFAEGHCCKVKWRVAYRGGFEERGNALIGLAPLA